VATADRDSSLNEASSQVAFLAHPLVGMAIIAAHRAATRATRDDTVELFDICPSHRSRRTVGVVWAGVVPAAVLAALAGAHFVMIAMWGNGLAWADPLAASVDVATTCLLGVGGVALGAALGRWVRFQLTPIIAIVIIGFVGLQLGASSEPEIETRMILSTFGPVADGAGGFSASQAFAHLAWIAGLVILTVAVARVRAADKDDEPLAAARGTTSNGDRGRRRSQ